MLFLNTCTATINVLSNVKLDKRKTEKDINTKKLIKNITEKKLTKTVQTKTLITSIQSNNTLICLLLFQIEVK